MPITDTMALAFSMPIAWLPVGGTMRRIACGRTTVRRVWSGLEAQRGCGFALSPIHGCQTATDDLAHTSRLVQAERQKACKGGCHNVR